MNKRCRQFRSLNECVNPEYMRYSNIVTTGEMITHCIGQIVDKARARQNRGYLVTIYLPNFTGKRSIMQHIFMEFSERIRGMNVKLDISDEEVYYPDVDVSFCAMKRDLPEMSIPVCWDDQLDDWTWQNVCANPQHYSTSSSEKWPPVHYSMRAARERQQQALNPLH